MSFCYLIRENKCCVHSGAFWEANNYLDELYCQAMNRIRASSSHRGCPNSPAPQIPSQASPLFMAKWQWYVLMGNDSLIEPLDGLKVICFEKPGLTGPVFPHQLPMKLTLSLSPPDSFSDFQHFTDYEDSEYVDRLGILSCLLCKGEINTQRHSSMD